MSRDRSLKKLGLYDIRKVLLWCYNFCKRPGFFPIKNVNKPKSITMIFLKEFSSITKQNSHKIRFNEKIQFNLLPHAITREVNIKRFNPDYSFITLDNLKYVSFIDLKCLYNSDIFIDSYVNVSSTEKMDAFTEETDFFLVSIDSEMVTTTIGKEIGRMSILDHKGTVLYDKIIKPRNEVLNYETRYSGLTKEILNDGISFGKMLEEIKNIIGHNTVILGHGLENDLNALGMHHDKLIDTSYIFLNTQSRRISLRQLAKKFLDKKIHGFSHSSVEDAKICLDLLSIKIQEIKYATSNDSEEIFLQTKINFFKNYENFLENVEPNTFNLCLCDSTEIKTPPEDHLIMFFYEQDGKTFIEF